jgi:hypothetical protein
MARHTMRTRQGSEFTMHVTVLDGQGQALDLSGYTAKFTLERTGATTMQKTHKNGITLGANAGTLALDFTRADTTRLTPGAAYSYDLTVTEPRGETRDVLHGALLMSEIPL